MGNQLDDFLNGESGQATEEEIPPVVAEEPKGETEVDAQPAEIPQPAAATDDDGAPPAPDGETVPTAALIAERAKRKDWKEKALRYEGRMAELQRQLDEAKRAPVAQQQVTHTQQEPPSTPPNPVEDPAGYHQFVQQTLFNERLNNSEAMVRQQYGDADVDEKLAVFKKAVDANPALRSELVKQLHPYKWVYEQAKRIQAMEEIGPDPTAYRSKLEAEIRAKIEAELAGSQSPPVRTPPAVSLPQSLGTARSAAPRSDAAYTGPTPLSDIIAPRKR